MSKKGGKFLLGVLVGAGVALLLAPKTGKEFRQDLRAKFDELLDKIKEYNLDDLKDSAIEKIKEIEKDLDSLDKETILKVAKEKAILIENKVRDLASNINESDEDDLKNLVSDASEKASKSIEYTIKKIEKNTK